MVDGQHSPILQEKRREAPMVETSDTIRINRAPVLTLWAAVVAERLGFDRATALTLGQAVAGLSAYAKGVSLGIIEPCPTGARAWRPAGRGRGATCRPARPRRARGADAGRTAGGEQGQAGQPGAIEKYLAGKFGAGSTTHGRPCPRWLQPTSPWICTGAAFASTRGSGPRCRRAKDRLGCDGRAGSREGAGSWRKLMAMPLAMGAGRGSHPALGAQFNA